MFATRTLRFGDLIVCERPMMMTPLQISAPIEFGPEFTNEQKAQAILFEWEKKMKISFDRMSETNRAAYMALANSHQHDGSGPLTGISRTNGFGVYDFQIATSKGKDEAYSAICKDISRMNHRCGARFATRENH